ncbi:MAG: 2-oxoacid:acceptor oxidoreductase subunit alpha [Acidobacteriota bacterium]
MSQPSQTVFAEEVEGKASNSLVVNDFSIQVATVNGSGSQSANNILMRSIFQMGIPVSGKNLFPSNIAGLPTWFTIRANKDGYIARRREVDVMVCMNPETASDDVRGLDPGGVVVFEQLLGLDKLRDDLVFYPVPFAKLAGEISPDSRLKKLLANMIYVGVLAHLLDIDRAEVERAVRKQFHSKPKAVDLNVKAIDVGFRHASENLTRRHPYRCQPMNKTQGMIIIDGNAAAALGCVFAGCTVVTWYPITPSSSLCESFIDYAKKYRIDKETGKATFAVVQAEDELAALGMVLGAGWAGARSMTSTSGPGISLMSEFAGLGYFAEIPAVIFDIQRVGPSTGLPTRTAQGDILSTVYLSHGDTQHVLLFPCSVTECFTMAQEAFDLAERLQTPIFVMSDLDLGMNNWMAEPFPYPDKAIDRGKVLTGEQLETIGKFERYRDVDGDAIPYRTLPGTDHKLASYFTRGSGHNEKAQYTERPEDYQNLVDRLRRKYVTARSLVPAPDVQQEDGAEVGIIAFGTTHWAIYESRHQLRQENGLKTDYLRLRALPFHQEIKDFVSRHKRIYVVEQNRDGQMAQLIRQEVGGECVKLRTVLHYNGLPIDARFVTEAILEQEKGAGL